MPPGRRVCCVVVYSARAGITDTRRSRADTELATAYDGRLTL